MILNGAEAILESLSREGAKVIFGIPGGVVIPLFDRLYDAAIPAILARHEQGAAHMADGYARATGEVGVCVATSGPGATNLVTGIATAYMDSSPIVAITGQVRTTAIGRDAFQEADIFGITMPIVKHNYLVKRAEELPQVLHDAFHIARTGRPGPVLVDVPVDASVQEFEYSPPKDRNLIGFKPTLDGHPRMIRKAAEVIAAAKKPLLYVGGGVVLSGAAEEVRRMVEITRIPVFSTLLGKGAFPETDPLCLGMAGMHGTAYANLAISECDLLIAIGARFDDRITGRLDKFAPHAKVIHIDVDPAEIGKNVPVLVPIVGDCKRVLTELIPLLKPREADEWNARCEELKRLYPLTYEPSEPGELKPQDVIREVYVMTEGKAIAVTDVGQHQMWAAQYYLCDRPRSFISSGGLGTMGFALPAAIGAQIGRPDEMVACICGDGGFQMTVQELAVAALKKLPIKYFIINNSCLGMVRQWQDMFWSKRYSCVDFEGVPDFVKLAEAYGARAFRATKVSEVRDVIAAALEVTGGPAIVDFRVRREENVMPMIRSGGSVEEMRLK